MHKPLSQWPRYPESSHLKHHSFQPHKNKTLRLITGAFPLCLSLSKYAVLYVLMQSTSRYLFCIVPTMKEDFNALCMISHLLVNTPFMEQWQWRVEITPPKDFKDTYGLFTQVEKTGISVFDLLAKGIDHDPVTIETESIKAGAITFNFPTVAGTSTVNLTMRDALDPVTGLPRFYQFFKALSKRVINDNGTVNLAKPDSKGAGGYLINLKLVSLINRAIIEEYKVFPQKLGNFTASVDGQGLVEYPATFMQFRSLG